MISVGANEIAAPMLQTNAEAKVMRAATYSSSSSSHGQGTRLVTGLTDLCGRGGGTYPDSNTKRYPDDLVRPAMVGHIRRMSRFMVTMPDLVYATSWHTGSWPPGPCSTKPFVAICPGTLRPGWHRRGRLSRCGDARRGPICRHGGVA
jgi:hypothetical protein